MKRVHADDKVITFQLSGRERDALIRILQSYPVVPPAHQPVSKGLKESGATEYQRLLDEALAEQRSANKHHVQKWLNASQRFKKGNSGYRLMVERADSEWLLQVLNDIRVGHWLQLGSPEPIDLKPQNIDPKLLPTWLAMEMSGYFQMILLEALEG